jgi:hypothetical protein
MPAMIGEKTERAVDNVFAACLCVGFVAKGRDYCIIVNSIVVLQCCGLAGGRETRQAETEARLAILERHRKGRAEAKGNR